MPMRIRQSAAMMVVVLALFLVGNTANAGWRDWLWPFGSQVPQEQTPSAGAQVPPGGPGPAGPPPGGQPGQAPGGPGPANPPPGPGTPPPGGQPGVTPGQAGPQGPQPGDNVAGQPQPGSFNQGQPAPQSGSGRFFCNSLGKEASKDECDAADKAKGEVKPPFPGTDHQPKPEDAERMRKENDERLQKESDQSRRQDEERMKKGDSMRREPEMKKDQMPFPGKGETEGMFPGKGATEGNFPGGKEGVQPQPSFEEQPEHRPEFFINPQQIRDVQRQIKDQKRELTRLSKQAKKLVGGEALAAEADALAAKLSDTEQKMKTLKGEELQEVMQEFWDAQIWEDVNGLRSKIELPKQLTQMEKEIKRVERLFNQKTYKRLTEYGLNLEKMQADLAGMRSTIEKVRSLLSSGSGEEAQEAMQDIWEGGGHPGEIGGVLQQMRGMTEGLRRVKNKEIRDLILEVFQPVIEAVNEGDYREANQLLNELWPEMNRILPKLYNLRRGPDASLRKKLEAFEARIQDKLQQGEAPQPSSTESEGGGEF